MDPDAEYDILIRCTQGDTKFSARVSREEGRKELA